MLFEASLSSELEKRSFLPKASEMTSFSSRLPKISLNTCTVSTMKSWARLCKIPTIKLDGLTWLQRISWKDSTTLWLRTMLWLGLAGEELCCLCLTEKSSTHKDPKRIRLISLKDALSHGQNKSRASWN